MMLGVEFQVNQFLKNLKCGQMMLNNRKLGKSRQQVQRFRYDWCSLLTVSWFP